MVGKKKSSPVGRKSAPTADSLVCIHCHIRVGFSGSLPATEYEKHLSKSIRTNHSIVKFDM